MTQELIVVGGGLAGSEAAWQAAQRGIKVRMYEMRPDKMTEAHRTGMLGELVCSNSLRSDDIHSAPGLLKEELSMGGSLIMEAARASSVPAGSALAVDRGIFSSFISDRLSGERNIEIIREEVTDLPDETAVIATGPLTSEPLTRALSGLVGSGHLYFYDAIAPIVDAGSLDYDEVFRASRYGKGGDDYLNCPMSKEQYKAFYGALMEADRVAPRGFEEEKVFEGCMPIEAMASRGFDTPRFGPMKPVGLRDPRTGREPFAVVQLRSENREMTAYNLVGFQTRLKWPDQKRVFGMIPGLQHAEFLRYGSIHRNTFINSPLCLRTDLTLKGRSTIYIAGQISGVEGYIESTAMGLIAGINASLALKGMPPVSVPDSTSHGALIRHITEQGRKDFQPSNINFGLFQLLAGAGRIRDKRRRKEMIARRAIEDWRSYLASVNASIVKEHGRNAAKVL